MFVLVRGHLVHKNTKSYALSQSDEKDAPEKLTKLLEFTEKAAACNYEYAKIQSLRAKYAQWL